MASTRRLTTATLLLGLMAASCGAAAAPSLTWPPIGGTPTGAPPIPPADASPTAPPRISPTASTSPARTDLRPDPNAATYAPRDPVVPARLEGTTHDIDWFISEPHMTVAEGLVREVWAFGGTVPGPVIRVGVGDTIRLHVVSRPPKLPGLAALMHPAVNVNPHALDIHGATGGWNDAMTPIQPGEERIFEFTAEHAGVWMYHGAAPPALLEIANGMYGMLIVEPEGGLGRVDQELFFIQGEWYLGRLHESASLERAAAVVPDPDFVVFNGIADQYLQHPIAVETGTRIRAFILDAGPNLESSFRIEGAVFDRVIKEGIELPIGNAGRWASQAVDLSPAQGAIVEFTLAEDGLYPIVTHAWNEADRGASGLLRAGDGDPLH